MIAKPSGKGPTISAFEVGRCFWYEGVSQSRHRHGSNGLRRGQGTILTICRIVLRVFLADDLVSSHRLVHCLEMLGRSLVLLNHVPPPVILSGERLAPLEVGTARVCTVIRLGLQVLVVDVTVEMCLGTELLVTTFVGAVVLAVMIALVMVKFVKMVETPPALVAC